MVGEWVSGWRGGWTQTDRWMNRWVDEQAIDGRTVRRVK